MFLKIEAGKGKINRLFPVFLWNRKGIAFSLQHIDKKTKFRS